jgi:hypothetical protein
VEKKREEKREREREKCANGCGDSSSADERVGKKKEEKNVPMDVVTAAAPTSEWKRATVSGSFVGARPLFF